MKIITKNIFYTFIAFVLLISFTNCIFSNESNYENDGDVKILTKQIISCNQNFTALTRFRLERYENNKIRYNYNCLNHPMIASNKQIYSDSTKLDIGNLGRGSSSNVLDRHNIKCKAGYAIKEFQLETVDKKIRYNYKCIKAELGSCRVIINNETPAGLQYDVTNLANQEVSVSNESKIVLTQILLNSRYEAGKGFLFYKFTECDLKESSKFETEPNFNGKGNNQWLDRHDINCANGALTGFKLINLEGEKMKYKFSCLPLAITNANSETINEETKFDVNLSLNYLDRHLINCPENYALRSFVQFNNQDEKTKYKYTCIKAKLGNCVEKISEATFASWKKGVLELEKQDIKTSDLKWKVLTKVKLNSRLDKEGFYVSYSYTECELENSPMNKELFLMKKPQL